MPRLCCFAAALLIGAAGCNEQAAGPASSSAPASAAETTASVSASASSGPAPDPPRTLSDATPEERRALCQQVVDSVWRVCGAGDRGRARFVELCANEHPVWTCAEAPLAGFAGCWVPLLPEATPACASWRAAFAKCDLEATVRERCPGYLAQVVSGSAAAQAGLAVGDLVRAVDGERFSALDDLAERVRASVGKPIVLTIQRGAEPPRDVTLSARRQSDGVYRIGVVPGVPPACPYLDVSSLPSCKRP